VRRGTVIVIALALLSTAAAKKTTKAKPGTLLSEGEIADEWDTIEDVATLPDGGVVIVGPSQNGVSGSHILVKAIDSSRAVKWSDTFTTKAVNRPDIAYGVAVDVKGSIVVAGSEGRDKGTKSWLRKYDAGGKTVWTVEDDAFTDAGDVAIDKDGNVFVALTKSDDVVAVRKLDADGNVVWTTTLDAPKMSSFASGIALAPNGDVVMCGNTGEDDDGDAWVAAVDAQGASRWWIDVAGTRASAIAVDAHGGIVVAGSARTDLWLRKYDKDGKEQWTKTYDGPAHLADSAKRVVIDGGDRIVVVGSQTTRERKKQEPDVDAVIRAYTPKGALVWMQTYGRKANAAEDTAGGVALDAAGNVIVVGTTMTINREGEVDGTYAWERGYAP
jgi:hypothetical protein